MSKYNYPPGADHLPRGDDEKYRESMDRIFGPRCPRNHPMEADHKAYLYRCTRCDHTEIIT